ncbi:hypothetical protein [Agathobaculum desmolans]|uniref:hypothetical protein n=1 Tax=Agathobaculum desmolans TaxID=39484 RepID=UPI00248D6308|nr:hypothetical protein [Agathobaculum desmolans]
MFFLSHQKDVSLSREEAAQMLKTNPAVLEAFEKEYLNYLTAAPDLNDFFRINAKQAAQIVKQQPVAPPSQEDLNKLPGMIDRIVRGLLEQTVAFLWDGKEQMHYRNFRNAVPVPPVMLEEVDDLPEQIRPQLTADAMVREIGEPGYLALLYYYKEFQKTRNRKKKKFCYDHFRQGLEILDLDLVMYEMLGCNKNTMGYWLPALLEGIKRQDFFRVPKTTVVKVPLTMLQLTRLEYAGLTPTTFAIVNEFCRRVFGLQPDQTYFVKTGTFSSKYDFRNACVQGASEVAELGQYLLFIHHQSLQMASPLNNVTMYGAGTTNEWVVREFVQDKENNPSIYMGLPLHTEYRVFVDFDTRQVLGISPYWKPDVMKARFSAAEDGHRPEMMHDYVVYSMHEETLMRRYGENAETVRQRVLEMLPDIPLSGQWSIDVMQNGEDFYVIDMALAAQSALKECVPEGLLYIPEENWLPELALKEEK